MRELLITLFAIALVDSTSMIPIAIVPLVVFLGQRRPLLSATGFLAGIFVVYLVAGLLLMFGLDAVTDLLRPRILRWWNQPNTPELILQLLVGVAILAAAWRYRGQPTSSPEPQAPPRASVGGAFLLGVSLTLVGLPGAVPYFGAIDQILRADLVLPASIGAIAFYSLAFLTPFVSLVLVRFLFPAHSERVFQVTASLTKRWGRALVAVALALLGTILVADAIGWFTGSPLLPVDPAYQPASEPGHGR